MADTPKSSKVGSIFDFPLVKRVFSYTHPYRWLFIGGVLLTIVVSLVAVIRPILYGKIIDQEVAYGNTSGLRIYILITMGVLFLETFLTYTNTLLTNYLGQSVIRDIRNQVFQHILNLRLRYYDKTPIGTLQTRTISDVETLNDVFRSGLVKIAGDLLQIFAVFGMMLYLNWQLALVILTAVPLLIMVTRVFQKNVKKSFQTLRKAVSDMNAFLQERITGMNIVHVFYREEIEARKFDEINQTSRKANIDSVLYYSIFFPVVELISALAMALLVWFGVSEIVRDSGMTFGILVQFIVYVNMFFRPIRMLADEFNTLQLGMVSADRVFSILDTKEIIPDEGKNAGFSKTEPLNIEFKDVWFSYQSEKSIEELQPEDYVLKGLSLKISQGEKVAFVGSTGSGKTTIINLLGRFYDIQKGEILINGIKIQDYKLSDLRSLMGVVLQDVFLFSGNIRDNITLNNPDIPQEIVEAAAKHVGADFIEDLPAQYNYEVRERGATLSLGQRQLIAFARVWVYDPQILILDEATANIDTESEEVIQKAIDKVMTGRTSIIVAHRLSTIQKADKIVVLDKGNLIEMGNHQQLLALKGKYFDLHQKQFAQV